MIHALAFLQGACQRLRLPGEPILPLAVVLLGVFLRIHFPGPVTDGLFCLLILPLSLLLFRDGAFGQFAPSRDGARRDGANQAAVRFTCLCFAALLALYIVGLAFEFSLKGMRHLAGLLIAGLLFLFCYRNGPALARSKLAALLFLGAALALFSLYLTPASLNPNTFSLILGYSLLNIGFLLIVWSENPKRQRIWALLALALAVVCGAFYGNRSWMLMVLLASLVYWGGGFFLRNWRGAAMLALASGALIALVILLLGSPRFAGLRSGFESFARDYTGSGVQSGREIFFQMTLDGIAQSPWFGNGPGAEVTTLSAGGNLAPATRQTGTGVSCFDSGNPALIADCELLLRIRNDLAGDSELLWTWDFHTPIDTWKGIKLAGEPARVTEISLLHNRLTGRIPPELGGLDQLVSLRLSFNLLTGGIPTELGQLANLQTLALNSNALSGAIPTELGQLSDLTELRLNDNRLSGPIPDSLAALSKLSFLFLEKNELHGQFPAALLERQKHDLLSIPRCQFSAQIGPELLADCTALLAARDLLDENAVLNWSPAIPIAYWKGVKLQGSPIRVVGLALSGINLSGRIPPQLGELDQLVSLQLKHNHLTGGIPDELGTLRNLEVLQLHGNRLSGRVPGVLSSLPSLKQLRLGGNKFARPMPPALREVEDHDLNVDLFCLPLPQVNPGLLRDCTLLLEMRDALAGAAPLNWKRSASLAFWEGIKLGGAPVRVVGLELRWRGLTGELPPALGELERLRSLRLFGNRLAGRIPPQLGKLADLEVLELNDNALTGAIPPELGDLAQLELLGLGGNRLQDVPPALCQVKEFESNRCLPSLQINPSLLRDASILLAARDALAGSAKLNWSDAVPIESWQGVQLEDQPKRVTGLNVGNLQLDGILPPALGRLSELVRLNLEGNRIAGAIPPQLGNLKQLEELRLNGNRLSGEVPEALLALGKLEVLHLAGNRLAGAAPPALHEVEDHDLNEELFCLPSPRATSGLLQDCALLLEIRDLLVGNSIKLNWHPSLPLGSWQGVELDGPSARVIGLHLPALALSGRIPAELGKLAKLRRLVLESNALTGAIPPELGDLEELEELRLRNNRLGGPVPEMLGQLPRLSLLRLAGNRFTAPMPAALRELADQDLDAELRCPLVPPANPGLIDDCAYLLTMRDALGDPEWSDAIPIESWPGINLGGEPPRVQALSLRNLQGEPGSLHIPPTLSNLKELRRVLLQGRALGGGIPPQLGNLKNLEVLGFRNSSLGGVIPPELGNLENLESLFLINDALEGPIPPELGNLKNLEALRLDNNDLEGPIPPELGNLERLTMLRIKRNNLTGAIPKQLGASGRLDFVELRGNRLQDCAPPPALLEASRNDFDQALLCLPLPASEAGLAQDAAALLAAKDALAGGAELNWNEKTPIPLWQGLTLHLVNQHPRVARLELPEMGLTGRIPPELGGLDQLKSLDLSGNRLSGAIPPQMGELKRLEELRLDRNALAGAVPPALGRLPSLSLVRLAGNPALGAIPASLHLVDDRDLELGPFCRAGTRSSSGLLRDCALLLAARDALSGDAIQLNWHRSAPLSFWRGVALGGAPARVVALDLSRLGLAGALPSELGGLDQLISLRLHRNALAGPIPPSLGKLINLQELTLSGNALTGRIPPQLGNLSKLQSLHLRRNQLNGPIPRTLGKLAALRVLTLDGNALTGAAPPQLGNLRNLAELRLGDQRKNGAPSAVAAPADPSPSPAKELEDEDSPTFAALASLLAEEPNGLDMEGDSEAPALGANLFCQQELTEANGKLFADCRRLLHLRRTLAGEAPLNWHEELPIASWQGIRLAGNPLRVAALELPHQGLNGRLPGGLARLNQLETLRLNGNQLAGPVPPRLGQLFKLRTLALDGNQLSGCLPKTLRDVGHRELELDLLCGPSSPWSKPALIEDAALLMSIRDPLAGDVRLNWNYDIPIQQWQGVVLDGNRERVTALDLSSTGLNGRIPPALGALDGLVQLRLSDNQLVGAVPPELGNLTQLNELALDGNRLTGALPEELGHLPRLNRLWLEGNQFSGRPSPKLCHLERFLLPLQLPRCVALPRNAIIGDAVNRLNRFMDPAPDRGIARTSHNLFLQMGLQTGVVGMALAALLCASLFFNLRLRWGGKVTLAQRFIAACVFLAVVHGAFEVFLLQGATTVGVLAWMLIGMGTGTVHGDQRSQWPPTARSEAQP